MMLYNEHDILDANVNPATGLATDYLNLFNEAIMLFEMGFDMPDMIEELVNWTKRDYVEHFENSGFELKDVVISAYHYAPVPIRTAFDEVCDRALNVFDSSIEILLSSNLEDETARNDLTERLRDMKALVIEMDSHIHGHGQASKSLQCEVDALF